MRGYMTQKQIPDLVNLRRWCGEFVPYDTANDGFFEVKPGCLVKRYGTRKGFWVYHAVMVDPLKEVRPADELRDLVDNRSLEKLQEEAENAIKQLLVRAHLGDRKAIKKLVLTVC